MGHGNQIASFLTSHSPWKSIHNLKNKTCVYLCICCLKNKSVAYIQRIISPEKCMSAASTKAPEITLNYLKKDHLFKVHTVKYSALLIKWITEPPPPLSLQKQSSQSSSTILVAKTKRKKIFLKWKMGTTTMVLPFK